MVNKLKVILAALSIAISFGAWPSSGIYKPASGPCDVTACAEAFSVTRALTVRYNGPLFQLYNGTSSLDIGQKNHIVDMTTWSSFCSGVPSNCVIGKIYGQINGNVLVPSTINLGGTPGFPNCSGGTNWTCAAPFTIDSSTGLPIINIGSEIGQSTQEYYNGTLGSTDTISTGINAGSSSISQVFNGWNTAPTGGFCCGVFMMAHLYSATPLQVGQDFGVGIRYGTTGTAGACSSATEYCLVIDWEGQSGCTPGQDLGNYGTAGENVTAIIAYNSATNGVTGSINNTNLFSNSPPAAFGNCSPGTAQVGKYIHLGGGGDLSTPAPLRMREGMFFNSAITSAQQTGIYNNINAFYQVNGSYIGIGDVVTSAASFLGLRAYSAATVGTAAIKIRRSSDSHTCDVLTSGGSTLRGVGGLGNTANCSAGGDAAQLASSFCSATSCFITEFYDQTGNGNHMLQATTADQALLSFNCITGNLPCAVFNGTTDFYASPSNACPVSTTPAVIGGMAMRTGNTNALNVLYQPCIQSGVGGTGLAFFQNANGAYCAYQFGSDQPGANDNSWHSFQCFGANTDPSSHFIVDGGDHAFGTGLAFFTGNGGVLGGYGSANSNLAGDFTEAYSYGTSLSVAKMQLICQNDSLYYGTPYC